MKKTDRKKNQQNKTPPQTNPITVLHTFEEYQTPSNIY